MYIKSKKRDWDFERDEKIEKAISRLLDKTVDHIIKRMNVFLSPDEDLQLFVSFGGKDSGDNDFRVFKLEKLVKNALSDTTEIDRKEMRISFEKILKLF